MTVNAENSAADASVQVKALCEAGIIPYEVKTVTAP